MIVIKITSIDIYDVVTIYVVTENHRISSKFLTVLPISYIPSRLAWNGHTIGGNSPARSNQADVPCQSEGPDIL